MDVTFFGVLNIGDMDSLALVRFPENRICYAIDLGCTSGPINDVMLGLANIYVTLDARYYIQSSVPRQRESQAPYSKKRAATAWNDTPNTILVELLSVCHKVSLITVIIGLSSNH